VRSVIRLINTPPTSFPTSAIRAAFRFGTIAAALLCWVLQVIIEPSEENLLCATLSGLAIIISSLYCFREAPIQKHLYSTLAVFGTCLVALGLALYGMTLEWRPLTFNLRFPVLTFASSLFFVVICIAAHALFSSSALLSMFSHKIRDAVYKPLGLLRVPSDVELWVLGAIGIVAVLLSASGSEVYGANGIKSGDVGAKFLQAFIGFAAAPYIILFKNGLISNRTKSSTISNWALGGYFVATLGIAMARNARAAFAEVILIIAVCVMAMLLKGAIRINSRTLAIMGAVAIIGLPFAGLLGNLSTAITIVRAERYSLSTGALVAKTIDTMMSPELIKNAEERNNVITGAYNEIYFNNEFFTRFSFTKYTDINWAAIGGFPEVSPVLHDLAVTNLDDHLWGLMPTPMLEAFHINIDKDSRRYISSSGDLYVSYASIQDVGGFITGSSIVDSWVLFGLLAPFLIMGVVIVYYIFMDSFLTFDGKGNVFVLAFSVILAAKIFKELLLPEGFYVYPGFFLRALPQLVVFYFLITQGTNAAFNWIARPGGIREGSARRFGRTVRRAERR
jgi:hypothetical protein